MTVQPLLAPLPTAPITPIAPGTPIPPAGTRQVGTLATLGDSTCVGLGDPVPGGGWRGFPVLLRDALWAGKLALYLASFIGIGGAFFQAWAPGAKTAGRLIGAVLCAGLIATPLTIGLQGLDALELPLSALGLRAFRFTDAPAFARQLEALGLGGDSP